MASKKNPEMPQAVITFPQSKAERTKLQNKAAFGDKIRALRTAKGLTQPQLAEMLGVTKNAITNWEAGASRPDLATIPLLCTHLDISADTFFGMAQKTDALSKAEKEHMLLYRALTRYQRNSVDTLMTAMIDNNEQAIRDEYEAAFSHISRTELKASAGTGMPLTDEFEQDFVFLRNCRSVCRADIAGEGFVKEYQPDGLHSHNKKYKLIRPVQDDNFRCVGRVLDVVTPEMLPNPQELAVLNEIYSKKK